MHKCKISKIDEVKVYNTKEVQDLYKKVFNAANEMDFTSHLNLGNRSMIYHSNTFSVKLEENHMSLFLIPIVIHNKTYHFVVDTGAQISGIVSKHHDLIKQFMNEMKIPIKSAAGNQKEMQSICVDHLFLGALEIENQPFVVLDKESFVLPFIKKEIFEFDGIIGWDILSQFDFELDTKKGIFSIIKSEEKFTYCNLIGSLFPVVIVYDEDKKPALFGMDSGAKESWVNKEYIDHKNLKIIRELKRFNVGVLGLERSKVQLIKECCVSFFESKIMMENIRTGQTQVFLHLALDGIFGNEIFKNKTIQFLNSKGIVRII